MELVIFLLPYFLHSYLMGDFSIENSPENIAKKPLLSGIKLFESEKIAEAFRFFENSLIENPKSAYAYLYKAKCHYYFENYEAALLDLIKSLQLDNTIKETYLLKATCHDNLEDYDQSLKEYRRATQFYLDKNPEIIFKIGFLELRNGNFDKANEAFRSAAKLGNQEAVNYLYQMNDYYKTS